MPAHSKNDCYDSKKANFFGYSFPTTFEPSWKSLKGLDEEGRLTKTQSSEVMLPPVGALLGVTKVSDGLIITMSWFWKGKNGILVLLDCLEKEIIFM